MKIFDLLKTDKKAFLKILSIITWSQNSIPISLEKESKKIRFLTYLYASIISVICFFSFLSLITISNSNSSAKEHWQRFLSTVQVITFFVFLFDYVMHFLTYRTKNNLTTPHWKSTLNYLFSFKAIIIMLCVFASFNAIEFLLPASENNSYQLSGAARFFSHFKSLNIFKIIRFLFILQLFAPFKIITSVFQDQKSVLTYVFILIMILIVIFALLIWNNELNYLENIQKQWLLDNQNSIPELSNKQYTVNDYYQHLLNGKIALPSSLVASFQTLSNGYVTDIWDALYFTTITLTTIGYGDFVPHAPISKGIVMFISLVSIAIIAIPSGIIAGSFLSEMQNHIKKTKKSKNQEQTIDLDQAAKLESQKGDKND
ncbi:potassium channel family protein [Mycoplasma nasistruthionis]|uniref:Potassium channel family protein n=1 Tax=Mycoplasma nasistruthionis TaxID=353852 RepID=A0A5B7XV10_9MOLU|nr:potassium channel family protein [Mycoplasma nasistruthionis]QCZ36709.1 potassium channel family protein [Mycoplasma nasistruthionis]